VRKEIFDALDGEDEEGRHCISVRSWQNLILRIYCVSPAGSECPDTTDILCLSGGFRMLLDYVPPNMDSLNKALKYN
jgi:hypothetical protein